MTAQTKMKFKLLSGKHHTGGRCIRADQLNDLTEQDIIELAEHLAIDVSGYDTLEAKKEYLRKRAFGTGYVTTPVKTYRAKNANDPSDYTGDIIETDVDLEAKFNKGASIKFQRVYEHGQAAPPTVISDFERMTTKQLIAFAEAEEIDVKDLKAKADIIARIRQAL